MRTRTLAFVAIALCCWFALSTTADSHEPVKECFLWDSMPDTHHVSDHCGTLTPRRIVIVSSENRQDRLKEQTLFGESLAKHLSNGRKFDVVVSNTPICRDHLPMQSGTFDELHLLQLSRKYRADCVLYCDLERIDAYQPMQAELSMLLVHVGEAVALVSAKSSYNLSDPTTLKMYRRYLHVEEPESALSVDQLTPSPFIDFTANHFANGILSLW